MSFLTPLLAESVQHAEMDDETPIFAALVTDALRSDASAPRGRHHLTRPYTAWRVPTADALERLIATARPVDPAAVPSPRGHERLTDRAGGRHRLAAVPAR